MLKDQIIERISQWVDGLLKFKGLLEIVDGPAIKAVTKAADKLALEKINPVYWNVINEIILHLLDGEFELAQNKTAVLLADSIKTPGYDGTPEEIKLYQNTLENLYLIIKYFADKQKAVRLVA